MKRTFKNWFIVGTLVYKAIVAVKITVPFNRSGHTETKMLINFPIPCLSFREMWDTESLS